MLKGNFILQPSFFRGYANFQGVVRLQRKEKERTKISNPENGFGELGFIYRARQPPNCFFVGGGGTLH